MNIYTILQIKVLKRWDKTNVFNYLTRIENIYFIFNHTLYNLWHYTIQYFTSMHGLLMSYLLTLWVCIKPVAYEYTRRGARLVLVARREDHLQVVADKARQIGSLEVIVVAADVSKVENCKRFVEEAVNHFGPCKCSICFYFPLILFVNFGNVL